MEQLNQRITAVQNYLDILYMLKRRKEKGDEVTEGMINAFCSVGEEVDEYYPFENSMEVADKILNTQWG